MVDVASEFPKFPLCLVAIPQRAERLECGCGSRELETVLMGMLIYLTISLSISAVMNWAVGRCVKRR